MRNDKIAIVKIMYVWGNYISMELLNSENYRKKVHGCFAGKTIGGTLGMPFEGDLSTREISYYDPVPQKMLPNDDLDIQVINLEILLRTGFPVCRYNLGETWKHHISDFAPDEYGPARSNHKNMIYAPASGTFRNKFTNGMGAAIRSELWACLMPCNPKLAALLAREDASTDHGGDGIYAEMFLAAVESAAFCEKDILKLIDAGLQNIPRDSRLYAAVSDTVRFWDEERNLMKVRGLILNKYYSPNWTDVIINLSFIVLSLLAAEGSFDKAVCGAVSLGYDTDCTGATAGAVMGIINPDIDERWKKPIGDGLVLTSSIINMHEPRSVSEFCETVIAAAAACREYYDQSTAVEFPGDLKRISLVPPWTDNYKAVYDWDENSNESIIMTKPFLARLIYPKSTASYPNTKNIYGLSITNYSPSDAELEISISAPDSWLLNLKDTHVKINAGKTAGIQFELIPQRCEKRCPLNIITVNITSNNMRFSANAGVPVTIPWIAADENGTEKAVESPAPFFEVPDGEYTYKTYIKSPAKKRVRITACGTRPSRLYINGSLKHEHDGKHYVPAFHRDGGSFDTELENGINEITVEFDENMRGEFFLGFGTLYFCTQWDDSIEYIRREAAFDV